MPYGGGINRYCGYPAYGGYEPGGMWDNWYISRVFAAGGGNGMAGGPPFSVEFLRLA